MTRLRVTLALGLVLAVVLGMAGSTVRVPYVALGDGPTFDVLGTVDGRTVVTVDGPVPVFPPAGQLRMTTVSVTSRVTLFGAMATWIYGDREVVPRESVYPSGQTRQQVDAENTRQFVASESDAATAALRFLGYPGDVDVAQVTENGPAAGRLAAGDHILTVAGRPVSAPQDVVDTVTAAAPGTPLALRVLRAGRPLDVVVPLGARPDAPGRGYLGVVPQAGVEAPVDVSISLADVGGPSAGLVFATAVVDKLTPGDLTGGRVVAGTGTIDAGGTVGPIGGIAFKMDAARDAGATLFLVPAGNCREARSAAPDGLVLARVGDLREGVAALDAARAGRVPPTC